VQNDLAKITAQMKSNRLGHAYIIFGTLAEQDLAKILSVGEPDMFRITESPIKISHIRSLSRWIQLKPHSSPRKMAIIYDMDNMTVEAGNALLKILEEPPPNSILVLQALKKEKILPTILSRCQIMRVLSKTVGNILPSYLAPNQISKLSVKDRFNYANQIFQSEELPDILNNWERYFHEELLKNMPKLDILKHISESRDLLSTNSSVKLLVENLLLNF
jgi:hypothetical protein